MFGIAQLWIPFVVLASTGQVLRNAMQRGLTASLGTVGATNIRFLFGFPFSLIFLAAVLAVTHDPLPTRLPAFWPWLVVGAMAQIVATAMMLAAMNLRSFVVARINPLRWIQGELPTPKEVLTTMRDRAAKFNAEKVKQDDLARMGGGVPDEDG